MDLAYLPKHFGVCVHGLFKIRGVRRFLIARGSFRLSAPKGSFFMTCFRHGKSSAFGGPQNSEKHKRGGVFKPGNIWVFCELI